MSGKGGMDGGWFFPVDMPLKLAVEAADSGEAIKKFSDWAETHGVTTVYVVGRDMGAAPPRQTELRIKVPGADSSVSLFFRLPAHCVSGTSPNWFGRIFFIRVSTISRRSSSHFERIKTRESCVIRDYLI
jgi:hypothetical protein